MKLKMILILMMHVLLMKMIEEDDVDVDNN